MKIYTKHPQLESRSSIIKFIWSAIIKRKILVFSLLFLLVTLPIVYLTLKYQSKTDFQIEKNI